MSENNLKCSECGVEVAQHSSGKCLDRCALLIVKGYLEWDYASGDWNGPEGVTFFADVGGDRLAVYENGAEEPTSYLSPSTNINAAWLLLHKFSDGAIEIRNSHKVGCAPWIVYIGYVRGIGETVELAITRAAIIAAAKEQS